MKKKKILLVDDERGFTAMLSINLEATGEYEVRAENNPRHAVSAALQFHPDVILLDVIMPYLEGPDIAHQIEKNRDLQGVPIIFLTATVRNDEVASHGGKIGGRTFVAKPSKLSDLLFFIQKSLLGAA